MVSAGTLSRRSMPQPTNHPARGAPPPRAGCLTSLFYVGAALTLVGLGFPRVSALLLACRRGNAAATRNHEDEVTAEGKDSIRQVIGLRQRVPFWQAGALVLGFFALAVGMFALLPLEQTSTYLAENVFWWFPGCGQTDDPAAGAGAFVLPILILQVLIDGVANPVVEEVYFRVLPAPSPRPRASRLACAGHQHGAIYGGASLAAICLRHDIYHGAAPHPDHVVAEKLLRQGAAHCLANTIGATMSLVAHLQATS